MRDNALDMVSLLLAREPIDGCVPSSLLSRGVANESRPVRIVG
jgi:hypothetical protein